MVRGTISHIKVQTIHLVLLLLKRLKVLKLYILRPVACLNALVVCEASHCKKATKIFTKYPEEQENFFVQNQFTPTAMYTHYQATLTERVPIDLTTSITLTVYVFVLFSILRK